MYVPSKLADRSQKLNLTEFNWIDTPNPNYVGSEWFIECPVVIIAHI